MDLQPLNPADYDFGPSPWNNPRSYAPNLYEGLGAMPPLREARAATPSGLSRLRRLRASIASAIARLIASDAYFLIIGALCAADVGFVIALVRP